MNQIFQDITPIIGGIRVDLSTILSAIVFLWLLVLGIDLIREMLGGRIMSGRLNKAADYWEDQSRDVRVARDSNQNGSFDWDEQDRIYKKLLNRSADLRVRGWKN